MMRILVTGADGFIGKNLCLHLTERDDVELLKFSRNDTFDDLRRYCHSADSVVHLAGINRPIDDSEFEGGNVNLTKILCDLLQETGRKVPVIFTSSIHVGQDHVYGRTKLAAELKLQEYADESGSEVYIYRLPNVFGKWCKPNYNSVVATFCYNIINSRPIRIDDPDKVLKLAYIDDVIGEFIDVIIGEKVDNDLCINPTYEITLSELASQLYSFKNSRKTYQVEAVGKGLIRALYATYLSYYEPGTFSYKLEQHADHRGNFVEMIKTNDSGQVSYFTLKPGVTRGEHYHHSKNEKFLVVKGSARFNFCHVISEEKHVIDVDSHDPQIIETIPGWAHDIKNTGDDDLIVIIWANEQFNPEKKDTYHYIVDCA